MVNNFGLWNETLGLESEEFQISDIKDHSIPIFKLQYWQLVLFICYYSVCAIITIVGEALVIFYIARHAPKNRPLNRMILIDQVGFPAFFNFLTYIFFLLTFSRNAFNNTIHGD